MERRVRDGKRVSAVKTAMGRERIATGTLANSIGADMQKIL
jgi:hypothetical protein